MQAILHESKNTQSTPLKCFCQFSASFRNAKPSHHLEEFCGADNYPEK